MKSCLDCKHQKEYALCSNPMVREKSCLDARSDTGSCEKQAIYFEPKEDVWEIATILLEKIIQQRQAKRYRL